jgi:hypothetical protein
MLFDPGFERLEMFEFDNEKNRQPVSSNRDMNNIRSINDWVTTLQRQNAENWKKILPEKE